MISICSGWVGTHLERDSVPGVSCGLKGVGCKFSNFPSLEMRFALDLTKICVLITLLCFSRGALHSLENEIFLEQKDLYRFLMDFS